MSKKNVRADFRSAVFARDHYRCKCCGRPGKDRQGGDGHKKYHPRVPEAQLCDLDSHHIMSRDLLPHGGYVAENGISVCEDCHLEAEIHWHGRGVAKPEFSPDALYVLIGSSEQEAVAASEGLRE